MSGDLNIRWQVNKTDLAGAALKAAAGKALKDAAENLLTEANKTVPLEEATLERSGKASVDRAALKAAVSYDTPYAVYQHERTDLRHTNGRRAKWLEQTFREMSARLGEFIAGRIRGDIG